MEVAAEMLRMFVQTPLGVPAHWWAVILTSFAICQVTYPVSHWLSIKYVKSYKGLPDVEKKEWQSRVASTMHAAFVFPFALYISLTDLELRKNPVHGQNPVSEFIYCVAVGYFASDFVLIVKYNIPPLIPIILHHVFGGWGFLTSVTPFKAATWYSTYLLLTEASTPFNNTYWMLERCGMKDKPIGRFFGLGFAATWAVFRVGINPYLFYQTWAHFDELRGMSAYLQLLFLLNFVFLVGLNTYWFIAGPFYGIVFGEKKAANAGSQKSNNPKYE
mmetsp:Transcript_18748/g.26232  ORF Transcript_18748/g.26232 Transcript_18748/m.26232 type:complete len:274 (+) Transcript_18748:66-887(+)